MLFELHIEILSGVRKGTFITLPEIERLTEQELPHLGGNSNHFVLEDEFLEFRLKAHKKYKQALLKIYQHIIINTETHIGENDIIEFCWKPNSFNYKDQLFINYFGISELKIDLVDEDLNEKSIIFQPLQVLAKKSSISDIENMFDYLSNIPSCNLHSVLSASKYGGDFTSKIRESSPQEFIEKLRISKNLLVEILPYLINHPITRLEPEYKCLQPSGTEEVNETTISWLMENLSVLEPDEDTNQAHINYNNQLYRASSMYVPLLTEKSDIYENQVIHGYVESLIREAQHVLTKYKNLNSPIAIQSPSGYISFFETLNSFKSKLIDHEILELEKNIDTLRSIRDFLKKRLPVTKILTKRPIFTPKIKVNYIYRKIYIEIINWLEKKSIDWTVYNQLFSINNIPFLFEMYSYFRVVESVNNFFENNTYNTNNSILSKKLKLTFIDNNDNEIKIEKEPDYWTLQHSKVHCEKIVNSEGYTITTNNYFNIRGQKGLYSKRQPDIVIQIKNNDVIKLIVLDAKYTSQRIAFSKYLPELTMKYIHGIHKFEQTASTIDSLTILYPASSMSFMSYHHKDMSIFGQHPVTPNLQILGLIIGKNRSQDDLNRFITKILQLHNIEP